MTGFLRYSFPLDQFALRIEQIRALTGPGFDNEIGRINEKFMRLEAQGGFSVYDKLERDLLMGPKISGIFEKAEETAIFIITLGKEYEVIADTYRGDALLYYLTDVIASEYAEIVASELNKTIAEYSSLLALGSSNRYSPGYCGWILSGQKPLFSYLPQFPCGVELNDSCLMKPVKSVSGAVAIGKNIKFKKYDCETCRDERCLYRNKFIL